MRWEDRDYGYLLRYYKVALLIIIHFVLPAHFLHGAWHGGDGRRLPCMLHTPPIPGEGSVSYAFLSGVHLPGGAGSAPPRTPPLPLMASQPYLHEVHEVDSSPQTPGPETTRPKKYFLTGYVKLETDFAIHNREGNVGICVRLLRRTPNYG